jgi:hypothetical protein
MSDLAVSAFAVTTRIDPQPAADSHCQAASISPAPSQSQLPSRSTAKSSTKPWPGRP